MTTLIISSIIALLVIAGAALAVSRWLHFCVENDKLNSHKRTFREDNGCTFTLSEKQIQEINAQLKPRVYINGKFIGFLESDDEKGQKLVEEAKDILNKHQ